MKKTLLFFILLGSVMQTKAQTYMGYIPDNFAGIQGVLFNPASIADSRFRADINLFSTSSSLVNDYYGVSLFELPKSSYDFDKEAVRTPSKNNGGILYSDVLGTSFMFNIAPKHTIALYSRARAIMNGTDINGELFDQFDGGLDTASDFLINVGNPKIVGQTWAEVGATYAAVLWLNGEHFLKGGFTAKYLLGGINSYVDGNNVSASFNQTGDPTTSTLSTTGTITIGSSQDFITGDEDVKFDPNSKGFGADLGLVYEWRPDYITYNSDDVKSICFRDLNKYKLRVGVSVTDIGQISYDKMKQDIYKINGIVTQEELEDVDFDNLGDFLEAHYGTPVTVYQKSKSNLPTMLHADVDWNVYQKFYLNMTGNFNLVDNAGMNKTYSQNSWMLTPRYETKWFTFSLPINYMEFTGMQVGTGLRFGPLFVGSSSVITNLISKESKAADVYLGFKIPVYQHKFKDTDEDGILDHDDSCPKLVGPAENKGCPWTDADNDGVADKDDKCPKEAGAKENNGCPWGDTDNDTIKDNIDACPTVAGPIENKGCPWPDTDGDSVLDKDDKCPNEKGLLANGGCPEYDADKDGVTDKADACPTVAGPASNKGCPEVTQETLKELKVQARAVFFVTGKAVLQTADKGQTDGRLDAIKEIIKNYPNAKFSIEGHTDNVGNAKANQKLSEARAKAVMDALIAKGVNPENLTYKGYGASKPVASNKTAKGRAQNRRTEVIHVGTVYEGRL